MPCHKCLLRRLGADRHRHDAHGQVNDQFVEQTHSGRATAELVATAAGEHQGTTPGSPDPAPGNTQAPDAGPPTRPAPTQGAP